MHVVHAGREADHYAVIYRDRNVMTRIAQELARALRVDRVVEHVGVNAVQYAFVAGAEQSDLKAV